MINLPKPKTTPVIEWIFSARDVDNGDTITDKMMIANGHDEKKVESFINAFLHNNHPITSLSGNTWTIESLEKTGGQLNKVESYELISQPKPEFDKEIYPIMNNG